YCTFAIYILSRHDALPICINSGSKGFDFAITGKGSFGHQILNSYRSHADNEFHNYTTDILGRWTGEGTSNKLPRLTAGNGVNRIDRKSTSLDSIHVKI